MILELGSTGDDVKKLQTALGLPADGAFGAETKTKLEQWQSQNGLTADGIVGDETWNKLFSTTEEAAPVSQAIDSDVLNKLTGLIPDNVLAQIPATAAKFNISTTLRLAHFLAQCAHESADFKLTEENLNYSAEGLQDTFGRYFPGNLSASYARNPAKIACRVYALRMGNGNEASGDGYKYRGRGYIQLTGKSNYSAFGKFIGEDTENNPDVVASQYPLESAAFFFCSNNIWRLCDGGATEADVTAVTRVVNGGINGLADRLTYFNRYYTAIGYGFRFLENSLSSPIAAG